MDLKEFIHQTVSGIVGGISDSRKSNPEHTIVLYSNAGGQSVEFDVAVTVEAKESEKTEGSGGAEIKVLSLGSLGGKVGTESLSEQKNSLVSRIRFGVTVSDRRNME